MNYLPEVDDSLGRLLLGMSTSAVAMYTSAVAMVGDGGGINRWVPGL